MPATSTPIGAQAVHEQNAPSAERRDQMQLLHREFVRTARRNPKAFAMGDQRAPEVTFSDALIKTVFLARRLKPLWQGQSMVGIFLPPSVAGALVNFAALLMGKIPINLNYTASEEVLASCIRQCGIETVVSSQLFLDKIKLSLPVPILKLEEVAAKPRLPEKVAALLAAKFLPIGSLEKFLGREKPGQPEELATIIFSSGSTGDPKGIMLTHDNIASNIEQVWRVFNFESGDKFLGILPFFHSFGFTVTLMLAATRGIGVAFHPNPMDAKAIGELSRRYKLTYIITTPTFLQMYHRACGPDDFRSVKIVLTGAEKLPQRLAEAFEKKFGIAPLEGYGCTECAPVVSANRPDIVQDGIRHVCNKPGTIGRPIPGLSVKIVDPDTKEPLGPNQPGLLLVKGPNVMAGYWQRKEQTDEVLRDGWYTTGDIVAQDEDGFLRITDRLSRFSKIGGEMVPHVGVEEKLHELAGVTERSFVVTGVPDEKKGERLVVLHTLAEEQLGGVIEGLPKLDLPKLWIPRGDQFFRVESLPVLGSGKLDLQKSKKLALALAQKSGSAAAGREQGSD